MIWDLVSGLFSGLWGYVATAAAAVLVIVAARISGWRSARARARAQAAEDHIETRKEVEDAIADSRRTGGTWRDRLSKHRK